MSHILEKLRIYDAYKSAQKKRQPEGRHNEQLLDLHEMKWHLEYYQCITLEKDKEISRISKQYADRFRAIEEQYSHIQEMLSLATEERERTEQELAESHLEAEAANNIMKDLCQDLQDLQCERDRMKDVESALFNFAQCRICLEMIDSVALLACGHMFCSLCINHWRDVNKPWAYGDNEFEIYKTYPCPTCRMEGRMFEGSDHAFRELFNFIPSVSTVEDSSV